jgi:hypothetical protein
MAQDGPMPECADNHPATASCRMLKTLLDRLRVAPLVPKEGIAFPVVDEDRHKAEIKQIKTILDGMALSQGLRDFLAQKTKDMARAAAQGHSPASLRATWGTHAGQPGGDLEAFIAKQCALFSDQALVFVPSPLHVMPVSWNIRGSFNVASQPGLACADNQKALTHKTLPPIILNRTILAKDDVLGAQEAAFHEQMHSIFWQLGQAAFHREIPENHPFYNDAMTICARIVNGVEYMPHTIPGLYHADPLENACQHYEALFVRESLAQAQAQTQAQAGLSGVIKTAWHRTFS